MYVQVRNLKYIYKVKTKNNKSIYIFIRHIRLRISMHVFNDLITLMQIEISYQYIIDKSDFRAFTGESMHTQMCLYSVNVVIDYAFQQK